jgi:hypothetical protein
MTIQYTSAESMAELAAALKDATVAGVSVSISLTVRHAMELSGVKKAAFEAAPGPDEPPVKLRRLARLAKRPHGGSYFRKVVMELVDDGFLVRVSGGVRKAWQTPGEARQSPGEKQAKSR